MYGCATREHYRAGSSCAVATQQCSCCAEPEVNEQFLHSHTRHLHQYLTDNSDKAF